MLSTLNLCPNTYHNTAKDVREAHALKNSNMKCIDGEEDGDVIKKLSSAAGGNLENLYTVSEDPDAENPSSMSMSNTGAHADSELPIQANSELRIQADEQVDHPTSNNNDNESGRHEHDVLNQTATPCHSPPVPPSQLPFATNGPSSPIENAFARLAASAAVASIHIPAAPAQPNDENIDPRLFETGVPPTNNRPLSDYQIPGAIVDQYIASELMGHHKTVGTGKKCGMKKKSAENASTELENMEIGLRQPMLTATQKQSATWAANKAAAEARSHVLTAAQKRAATRAANKAAAEARSHVVEKELSGGRKRKSRVDPNGEEFVRPKKARRN